MSDAQTFYEEGRDYKARFCNVKRLSRSNYKKLCMTFLGIKTKFDAGHLQDLADDLAKDAVKELNKNYV